MATLTTMLQSTATRLTACAVPGAAAKRRRPGLSLPFMLLGSAVGVAALAFVCRRACAEGRCCGGCVRSASGSRRSCSCHSSAPDVD